MGRRVYILTVMSMHVKKPPSAESSLAVAGRAGPAGPQVRIVWVRKCKGNLSLNHKHVHKYEHTYRQQPTSQWHTSSVIHPLPRTASRPQDGLVLEVRQFLPEWQAAINGSQSAAAGGRPFLSPPGRMSGRECTRWNSF